MLNFFFKNIKKTIILIFVFLFLIGLIPFSVQAASITNREVRISDSRPSQTNVIYDFKGDTTNTSTKCIKVQFCNSANRSAACVAPTGLDASGATFYNSSPYVWNLFHDAGGWAVNSTTINSFELTDNSGENGGNNSSWVVSGITNPSVSGTSFAWINTYSDSGCSIAIDDGVVAFANVTGVSVSVIIGGSMPTISSIDPSSKYVNDPGFTMTVNGTNFVNGGSTVRFAGSDRSTTYISDTQLTAEILASDLETVGSYNITVFNTGVGESNPAVFSVNSRGGGGGDNPVPALLTINPTQKTVGDPAFIMTLTGSNFISSSVARFNGSARSTTYIDSNTLQAQITVEDLEVAGTFPMTVFNPSPGGGESASINFTVIPAGEENPLPVLNSIDPNSKIVGDDTFTMTLTGSNFISSSVVRFNGSARSTTYINSTSLTAQIPFSDLTVAGNFNITVFNPTPGGGESEAKIFTVSNPVPSLTSINPNQKTVGDPAFTMTLTGSNFISSSVVRFNGSARSTTYINATTLEAAILVTDLTSVGTFPMTVFNPTPGGGESGSQNFRVMALDENPIPALDVINPSWKYLNAEAFTMTITGQNFIESSIVRFNGANRSTTYISPTSLEAYILITDLQTLGDFPITVFNQGPGGGSSNSLIFRVLRSSDNPVPSLVSINPAWQYINSPGFTMTITGQVFLSSSIVRFNGSEKDTTYVSADTLRAIISASDLQTLGDFPITVFNPGPGGGESNSLFFRVILKGEEPEEEDEAPTILEPLDGTYTNNKNILVKGLAQPNKQIDIFINDQKRKTVFSDQAGNFEADFILEEGSYLIVAAVNEQRSAGVNLIVDLTPPEPPILLQATPSNQKLLLNQINFSLLVRGTNSADTASLRLVIGPEYTFSPDNQPWDKSLDLTLSPGQHQVYAFAYDLAGNISLPSNVLTFSIGLETEPPINIIPPMFVMPEIIEKIIDNPQIEKITQETSQIILPVATALSIGATASAIASAGMSLIQLLPALYFLFIQPLVYIFSKKGKRGWGIVYNSLTKQPIDLAVIRLFDAKTYRLLATRVSDKEGRYIFVVDPGVYRMMVTKQEYVFPSKILAEYKEDFKYIKLYHGQPIEVKEKSTVINASIPMDPDKKLKSNSWLIKDNLAFSLKIAMPVAALILSFLSFVINPNIYLLLLFILNLVLFIFVRSIRPKIKKDWGVVYDKKNKNPLNLTVVRIFDSAFDKLLDQQVTNSSGQYGFLVGGRKFYLTYNKNGYLEKTSQPLDFTKQQEGKIVGLDTYLERQKLEKSNDLNKNQPNFIVQPEKDQPVQEKQEGK